ncbi:MAG: hypothetical protein AAGJ96_01600 [Pseudomonadota bacterium]
MTRTERLHIATLTASKTADALLDAKIVIAWLLTTLGAPLGLISLAVPLREALSMLPQIAVAAKAESQTQRKRIWALGATGQAVGALVIAGSAAFAGEALAPIGILLGVALIGLARSACSATQKDLLARTVGADRRGTITGRAASLGGVGALLVAGALILTPEAHRLPLVLAGIALAALLFGTAAARFLALDEPDAEAKPNSRAAFLSFSTLCAEHRLQRLVAIRACLLPATLAPPFLIAAASTDIPFGQLGLLMAISAVAAIASGSFWGGWADKNPTRSLATAGAATALILVASATCALFGIDGTLWLPPLLFAQLVAYQGVRISRKTLLMAAAPKNEKPSWTAESNTLVGLLLLAFGLVSAGLSQLGAPTVLLVFALSCGLGGALAAQFKA